MSPSSKPTSVIGGVRTSYPRLLRILVPLTIADGDLREGLELLCDAIEQGD